jgi:predicted alternative tryptophan synthase beta-subunit
LGGNQLQLNNAAQTKNYIYAVDGAQVELKYNNALKLATTSTGIDVTGTVTADGLTVDGSSQTTSLLVNTGSTAWADVTQHRQLNKVKLLTRTQEIILTFTQPQISG